MDGTSFFRASTIHYTELSQMALSRALVTTPTVDSNLRKCHCNGFPQKMLPPRSFQQEVVGIAGFSGEKAQTPCRNDRAIWEIRAKKKTYESATIPAKMAFPIGTVSDTD
jgi:hypothetical protein